MVSVTYSILDISGFARIPTIGGPPTLSAEDPPGES